ncbi:phosphoglycerate dehydrogenase-like enzyme [Thermocatellispora tengchongensis]|uniref:Phosphoglycerate dehydrogenase-like enzyme n=1 Tax=Thermocatellispora tengchongensis TaxID=1073253 RepID=A0A840PF36_9ACTN|nr:D-2-hydroxyacid dehydrogenase family protein [Thermocatellispora tengchongensis]MBB5136451.1 phosphoglycerate dehydrogenase-like enzyme [Thermocatellispora tengchongensis]
MVRCAVLDDYQGVALAMADWSPVEATSFREPFAGPAELTRALAEFEIVVIMRERTPFPRGVFERLPKLRLLVTTGMRNASVDLAAARDHGVTVCGTGGAGTPPAELTWALILGLARHIVTESENVRAGGWQSTIGTGLHGRTLGLVGLGKIGSQVARVGLAFGMDVTAWSHNLTRERAEAQGVRRCGSLGELLAGADFVSIHLVLGERTRGLIGAAELALMRPTAYLVNTSRAAIVDQDALIDALARGRIAGAGLDVFDAEPLPPGHPFRSLPNVLATPHLGYVTENNYAVFYREAVEDIAAYLAGSPVRVLT